MLKFAAEGAPSGLLDALRESWTPSASHDAPPDGNSLARRAARDFAPLVDALWAYGYFDAASDDLDRRRRPAALGAMRALSSRRRAYRIAPGALEDQGRLGTQFRFRGLSCSAPDGRTALADLPAPHPRSETRRPGARGERAGGGGADRRLLTAAIEARWRRSVAVRPVVDHPARRDGLDVVVDPGPARRHRPQRRCKRPPTIPEIVIRSFVYLQEGEPYSPELLERTKASVRTIPAVGAARFRKERVLDPHSDIPLELDVSDRPQHAFGVSAQYSSIDGPLGQVYWEDRNLFGGAEYLRLQADLLYAPSALGSLTRGARRRRSRRPAGDAFRQTRACWVAATICWSTPRWSMSARLRLLCRLSVDDADGSRRLRHRFSDQWSVAGRRRGADRHGGGRARHDRLCAGRRARLR